MRSRQRAGLVARLAALPFLFGTCLGMAADLPPSDIQQVREQLLALQAAFEAMRAQHDAQVRELVEKLRRLESQSVPVPAPPAPLPPAAGMGGGTEVRYRLLDVSFNGLFAAGASSARDGVVSALQGGAHDPNARGFTVQNVELSLAGAVDPYLRGDAHLVFQIDQEGESFVEVEEAYLSTLSLPHGLQLRAGTYFTEFGRLNPRHPHSWDFVDQPVVNTRMFGGDGLRGPGARLSWLTPAPWYSELLFGVQRARGETAFSFLGTEEEGGFAGHPFVKDEVRSADDLLWSARWLNSVSVTDVTTLNVGASALHGPNATGEDADTWIGGLDVYLKWTKPTNEKGFPFLAWQTEVMRREYDADAFVDEETGDEIVAEELWDWGAYSQLVWGFKRGWTWGLRAEYAEGDESLASDNRLDPLRDRRRRLTTALTWYPTEFSKLRFQYNHDLAEFLGDGETGDEDSFWIQWEFTMGAHGAHQF